MAEEAPATGGLPGPAGWPGRPQGRSYGRSYGPVAGPAGIARATGEGGAARPRPEGRRPSALAVACARRAATELREGEHDLLPALQTLVLSLAL